MGFFKSKWSNWTDVSSGGSYSYKYVLQVRRHKNGKIQMRTEICQADQCLPAPKIEQLESINFKNKYL